MSDLNPRSVGAAALQVVANSFRRTPFLQRLRIGLGALRECRAHGGGEEGSCKETHRRIIV